VLIRDAEVKPKTAAALHQKGLPLRKQPQQAAVQAAQTRREREQGKLSNEMAQSAPTTLEGPLRIRPGSRRGQWIWFECEDVPSFTGM
jgi:hypothetical protein